MGVIGRLDEQVDAVLIGPLQRRGEPQPDEQAAAEQAEPPGRPAQPEARRAEPDAPRAATALPVWLL
jgi:hypothetical protein